MRSSALAALFLCSLFAFPRVALAYVESTVRSVSAEVRVGPDARAEVTLIARVRVDRGWLEALDLDGLDPDLELIAERPPTFFTAEGGELAPQVEVQENGRVTFAFRRRAAPQRGEYVATVAYRTSLAGRATEVTPDGAVRMRWTLPGWRYGLDDVRVTMIAPEGARLVRDELDEASVEVSESHVDGAARIELRRVHLPRTREWPVIVELPADRVDASLRAAPAAVVAPPPPTDGRSQQPLGTALLALALGVLAIVKNAIEARGAVAARSSVSPLVALPTFVRSIVALALAGIAAWNLERGELVLGVASSVAVALLALHREREEPTPARLGSFKPANAATLRAARRALRRERIGLGAWLDASTVPGATLAAALVAGPIVAWAHDAPVSPGVAAMLGALGGAILLSGGRRARPSPPLVELAHLLAIARREPATDLAFALRPVVHVGASGELQDARLRVHLPETPRGLLRTDVVRVARGSFALLVLTREGSPADQALASADDRRVADAPRRIARAFPLGRDIASTLAELESALADCPRDAERATAVSAPNDLAASA